MLCDVCKKREAQNHIIKQYNGTKVETHLCHECYRRLMSGGAGDIMESMLFSDFAPLFGTSRRKAGKACASCGTTEREFLETGFVGCEHCYEAFADTLAPRLSQIQHGNVHTGKTPSRRSSSPEAEYRRLKEEIKRAVAADDFERAMVLDGQLKRLRNGESEQ